MKPRVKGEWWELELADGWEAQIDEHCVTITHPDGCGALQISAYQKRSGSPVTRDDLLEHAASSDEVRRHLGEQAWGDFRGFQLVYAEDDRFWRRWWLARDTTFVFATYNCPHDQMDTENQSVNEMLSGLKERPHA